MSEKSRSRPDKQHSNETVACAIWDYLMVPLIEVAGSVQNLVRTSILSQSDLGRVKGLVPTFRGGTWEWEPAEWESLVRKLVRKRKLDLPLLQRTLSVK